MILSDIAVKRPTIAVVASMLLVVFGLVAFSQTPLRQYPDTDPPVVGINTEYPGASAEIIDTKITRVLEDQLSGLESIKYINSVSRDGSSSITIEFEIERDVDVAVNEVQQAIGRVLSRLPEEVDTPRVSKSDTNARPIVWFNLTSPKLNALELSDLANRTIVDRLSIVDGVSRVFISGGREYAMRIDLDPDKMAARGITTTDVEDRLRAENVELPAGKVESVDRDLGARITRLFHTPEDFARLAIKRGDDGHLVRLGEVAEIYIGAENEENMYHRDGDSMIGLGIVKQSQANTIEVAEKSRQAVEQLKQLLPQDVFIQDSTDSSIYINSAINEVYKTLFIAVVLVVLVIYYFLGTARATLVPAVTVPISLIASFIFVHYMGFTINLLTLLALVLAIGLVVDDTIVVLENIYRRIEKGEPPLLAAFRGAKQVGFAVVATTAVLVAVFVPLIFLEGNLGKLFKEFALTIAAAVVFSSFVALTLSPVLCSKIFRRGKSSSSSVLENVLTRLESAYLGALQKFSVKPVMAVLIVVTCIAVVAGLLKLVPGEFAPEEDTGTMFFTFYGPDSSSYERTRKTVGEIEEVILSNRDELAIERFLISAPSFFGGSVNNSAFGIVALSPWNERELTAGEVRNKVYTLLEQVPGGQVFFFEFSALTSGGSGRPVQVVVGADTYEDLEVWQEQLLDSLSGNPMLRNVDVDFSVAAQQVAINVNFERAAELGVAVSEVGRTLETLMGSRKVTTYEDRGEEYDVILEAMDTRLTSPDDIRDVYVRSRTTGRLVPLGNLVTITEQAVSLELPRYNRRRALTLSADIAPGYTLDEALEVVISTVKNELPGSATLDYKGQSLEYVRAGGSVMFVFAVAILVSYLVMAAQFESFLHPLLILLMVPTAAAGAMAGLYFTGQTLNIFSQIGLVMLIGLAAKNGILIVEFANQLRDYGMEFSEALYSAAQQRLRPILMTSLTTVFGAVPLLLAFGAGSEVRYVLGVVIFFGVLTSTLLTLFVLPSLYLHFARKSSTPGKVSARMEQLGEADSQR